MNSCPPHHTIIPVARFSVSIPVFLNRRAAARYRALASIIPGHERPEETTICYKISLVQLISNLNVILYLSTYHTVCISVLILNTFITNWYNVKNVELLKHSKISKNAPTCFGLQGNHFQGAKVSTWLKVTRLVKSRYVKDVQGVVSAMAAYCDCNKRIYVEYVK